MAEDLAIDVGLQRDSEDYKRFIACVNAIMEHGCGYSEKTMNSIREYCTESELPYAKKVLHECDRIQGNTSRIRPTRAKWWETYITRKERRNYGGRAIRDSKRRPISPDFDKRRRPISPEFEKRRRPMSLDFKKKRRPMSLDFDKKRRQSPPYDQRSPDEDRRKRRRPMSPVQPAVPRWPSRKRSRYN